MAQAEGNLDHDIPLLFLPPYWAKTVVGLLSIICFVNSYDGDFVFDDSEAIINNKDLRSETPLGDLWHHDFWGSKLSSNTSHKSYRPLTVLTFRINYLLAGGFHPLGFHIINIILHCVISVLIVDVFSILLGGLQYTNKGRRLNFVPKSSLLAALLFAVHPVHTECIAGIVGRADLLCALFFLLSFLVYCKAFRESKEGSNFSTTWVLLSVLLGATAMLCKEQGITILGLNALFDAVVINKLNILEILLKILHKDKSLESLVVFRKGLLFRITLLLSGGATVLYVRWRIMGTGPPAFTEVDNPASFDDSPLVRAINYNYYYSLNAWLLLCPWWLCFDWSMGCVPLIKSVSDWRIIALGVLWFCLIALMCQALCSEDSQKRRILTLGLGFLIIPFLPASNLFFRVGFVIAERVTYLPSIGYCMLITYGFSLLSKQVKKKKFLVAALLGVLVINVWRCVIRSNQWRSEEQLFRSALSVCPLNAKVHYNVGKNLADKGNQTAAINYYREAVRLNPKYVHAMNNLGNILKERNELQEAEELLLLAVQIQPDFAAAWMNLGIVQNSLRRYEEAEQSYWTAIRHRKKYPDCYYNLGRLYADLNRHVDALNAWRNATVLKPQHSLAWNNMIILLDNTGNLAQAEAVGREALELIPNDHALMFSLANVLGKSQKYKESEALFHKAIKANPTAASYHGNLAVLYHRWGNLDLAKKHYEVSLKLDPTAAGTRENYSLLKRKLDQLQKRGDV
ncbi:protein O-mannosyl-transferase TMTC4 isoform X1 [Sceloporus undulatus]|uniref:protein O-mannosyl-transferase TMTC4 isoform X1 n=2 Tax=Sceloporus undulatus TaxID=8520 RepID=UPI001C4C2FB7|nr:protein O-mannosyl-transferase TMTC4 isoform X1 [Sceloporus undulatus]XP_042315153.1 protein O-mannosyl-transferase TMTC4 isoform X1 [Sceloporus undulatus]XP_042315155.1 protein O-mannosyl-transferase TMTC4 isoform X1 [Sceloporus undulatus]XP_042315156.1 protein O-mannosyl-transferase TMTC4 isoform X1 [Sceloporus undulatus]